MTDQKVQHFDITRVKTKSTQDQMQKYQSPQPKTIQYIQKSFSQQKFQDLPSEVKSNQPDPGIQTHSNASNFREQMIFQSPQQVQRQSNNLPIQYLSFTNLDKDQLKYIVKDLVQRINSLVQELQQITDISQRLLQSNQHLRDKYVQLQNKTKLLLGNENYAQNFPPDNSCNTTKLDIAQTNTILQNVQNNIQQYKQPIQKEDAQLYHKRNLTNYVQSHNSNSIINNNAGNNNNINNNNNNNNNNNGSHNNQTTAFDKNQDNYNHHFFNNTNSNINNVTNTSQNYIINQDDTNDKSQIQFITQQLQCETPGKFANNTGIIGQQQNVQDKQAELPKKVSFGQITDQEQFQDQSISKDASQNLQEYSNLLLQQPLQAKNDNVNNLHFGSFYNFMPKQKQTNTNLKSQNYYQQNFYDPKLSIQRAVSQHIQAIPQQGDVLTYNYSNRGPNKGNPNQSSKVESYNDKILYSLRGKTVFSNLQKQN